MTDKKKMTPLMICHLILMVIFALGNLVAGVWLLISASGGILMDYSVPTALLAVVGISCLSSTAALCCGCLYTLRQYSKDAAGLYKGFLLLTVVSALLYVAIYVLTFNVQFDNGQDTITLRVISCILMAVKALLLLALTFAKDLGKRNTWIVFGIVLAIDLVSGLLIPTSASFAGLRLATVLPRLLLTGTIGLAIKGKYDDKDARGTV